MERKPSIGFDPDRLREERHDVDLGEEESAFGSASDDSRNEVEGHSTLDEPTAGSTPPAR